MTAVAHPAGAAFLSSTGMHPDRWCEPTSSALIRRIESVEIGTALIWIRPNGSDPLRTRWGVQVDRGDPFVCELQQDRPICIGFAVRRPAGETFALTFSCDRQVIDGGADTRNLSFVLSSLSLGAGDRSSSKTEQGRLREFDYFIWTDACELEGHLIGAGGNTKVEAYLEGKRVAEVTTDSLGIFRLSIAREVAGHCARTLRVVAGESSTEIDVLVDPELVGKTRLKLPLPVIPATDKAIAVTADRSHVPASEDSDPTTAVMRALAVQTEALSVLLSRTAPEVSAAAVQELPTGPASLPERYGSLAEAAINAVGLGHDIIWLGVIDWNFRIQRPQHIVAGLARRGCRVFYISIVFAPADSRGRFEIVNSPEPGVFEVRLKLSCQLPPNIYRELDPQVVTEILLALDEAIGVLSIRAPAVVVQYPSWTPVAFGIPGAVVVHDCLDLVSGFDNTPPEIVNLEERLVDGADIVVTTSKPLNDHLAEKRPSALIRNGADVEFFAKAAIRPESSPYKGKVIGYFGAIAHWFETEWIRRAAEAHPEWTFVLIGSSDGADVRGLVQFPNILLLGERPYAELSDHLAYFDVAVIPFKLLDLILCTNPVKLYEYMAAGKPVVASAMPEVEAATDLVYIAADKDEFILKIERALEEDSKELARARMDWAQEHGWDKRAQSFSALLDQASPKVSIVILSYLSWPMTQATLWSVLTFSDYDNLEIIVVDNGSGEQVVSSLRKFAARDPRIKLTLSETNLGYAGGNNLGLREATGDYLILLNNDTFVTKGWVRDLIRPLMLDPAIGLVSPLTNNIGNEQKLTIAYSNMEEMALSSRALIRSHSRKRLETDCVAFFCVATRRDVIDTVGYLDEAYGLGFFEDDDYCRRVAKAGLRIQIVDDVFVHHHLSASFDKLPPQRKQELMERNKAIFERRWGPWKPHSYRTTPGFG